MRIKTTYNPHSGDGTTDWVAVDLDTYDPAGPHRPDDRRGPIGYGATEADAIADLKLLILCHRAAARIATPEGFQRLVELVEEQQERDEEERRIGRPEPKRRPN